MALTCAGISAKRQPSGPGRSEIGTLGQAFEEMRATLEGKQYVENYVQATLTLSTDPAQHAA